MQVPAAEPGVTARPAPAPTAAILPPVPRQPRAAPLPRVLAAPRRQAAHAPQAADEPPAVEIRIGRIEVAPARTEAATAPRPGPSLDAFLRRSGR